jgi:hypothetical protein
MDLTYLLCLCFLSQCTTATIKNFSMYLDVMAELYSDLSQYHITIISFGLTRQKMIVLANELNEIQSPLLLLLVHSPPSNNFHILCSCQVHGNGFMLYHFPVADDHQLHGNGRA